MGSGWLRSQLTKLLRRLRPGIPGQDPRAEVDEEFAFHLRMRTLELMEGGMPEEEARRAAAERFGDMDAVMVTCRRLSEQWEWKMMWTTVLSELLQDIRFGLRQLRRSPGLAVAAIATLGLGIGANTAVFSVVSGVMLSPLGYPDPDALVEVRTRYLPPSGFDLDRFEISIPELLDYREASEAYESLGAYTLDAKTLMLPDAEPVRIPTVFLDRRALEALGVQPALGRWFTEDEDLPDNSIGLLGHDLWATRFGADPDIVGRTATLNGRAFLITGVMPAGFAFPSAEYQIFENYGIDRTQPGNRAAHGSYGIGRLRPNATLAAAIAEAGTISAAWADEFPHNVAHFPILERLSDNIVGAEVRRTLLLLLAAVGMVILIATANVANLLMARGESRLGEMAVRVGLGASRGRIARQLMAESLTLAALGGLAGVAVGAVGLRTLLRIDPEALPRAGLIHLDGSVLAFTAVVTLLTALLFGVAPALQGGRAHPAAFARDTRTTSTARRRSFRRVLVGGQVALCMAVLVSAGVILKSFARLTSVDPGVDLRGRLVFTVAAVGDRYRDNVEIVRLFEDLQAALSEVPGVTSVSAVTHLPLTGRESRGDFAIEGRPRPTGDEPMWSAQWTAVLPGYFETMGIEVLAGRSLTTADVRDGEPVVVVSEDVVDQYFGGRSPLDRRVGLHQDSIRWARIVGIVPRTRTNSLDSGVIPQIYFPHAQGLGASLFTSRSMSFTVQVAGAPEELVQAIRAAASAVDPQLPLTGLGTMESVFDRSVARPRLLATLLTTFAGLALVLASVGVFGVVSYSVSRRTREIGIRMALGADRRSVLRGAVREGSWPALIGVLVGLPIAVGAGELFETILFDVSPRDPVVVMLVSALLVLVALMSSYLPARKAAALPPTLALRQE